MLKVKTFNNGCIKIDEDGTVHILQINNSSYDVELSLQQYKKVCSMVDNFNIQPERLSEKTSKDDAIV